MKPCQRSEGRREKEKQKKAQREGKRVCVCKDTVKPGEQKKTVIHGKSLIHARIHKFSAHVAAVLLWIARVVATVV